MMEFHSSEICIEKPFTRFFDSVLFFFLFFVVKPVFASIVFEGDSEKKKKNLTERRKVMLFFLCRVPDIANLSFITVDLKECSHQSIHILFLYLIIRKTLDT